MSQAASSSPALPDDPPPIIGEPPTAHPQARQVALPSLVSPWRIQHRLGDLAFLGLAAVLAPLRGRGADVLEIGSWEGRSAIFFLNYLRDCKIVCIDTFAGGVEHQTAGPFVAEVPLIEQRFDRNLAAFAGRVEKMTSASVPALQQLAAERRQFDLAYIDGSHLRDDVTADSNHAWPLVRPGGIVIWDDYTWSPDAPPEQRPQPAIDAFPRRA